MMIVTHKMKMDLADKPGRSILDVTQGDSIRVLELELLERGVAWQIPENLNVVIRYDKDDGTGGCYDTLPDGTLAWKARENRLCVALAPALCSTKGFVTLQIALIRELEQISTFVIGLDVEAEVAGGGEAEDYINLAKWLSIYGRVGPRGKSAYDIAVEHGFDGSEEAWLQILKGEQGIQGIQGFQGETPEIERPEGAPYILIKLGGEAVAAVHDGYSPLKGLDYFDGVTPHIGDNGNWWIAETDTGVRAKGTDGETPVIERNEELKWVDIKLNNEVVGRVWDGYSPVKGLDYFDGVTPHIGDNGNWWIAQIDTGVRAEGTDGETPVIERNEELKWVDIKLNNKVVGRVWDGYSPVKGLDYWTSDDKAQMVADVIAALPVYNGEVV